jgi:hypothetical protein
MTEMMFADEAAAFEREKVERARQEAPGPLEGRTDSARLS